MRNTVKMLRARANSIVLMTERTLICSHKSSKSNGSDLASSKRRGKSSRRSVEKTEFEEEKNQAMFASFSQHIETEGAQLKASNSLFKTMEGKDQMDKFLNVKSTLTIDSIRK